MKKIFCILNLLWPVTVFCQQGLLSVSNPGETARADELLVLSRAFIEKELGKGGTRFLDITESGRPVSLQHDDLDGDGAWDEVAVLATFRPGERKHWQLQWVAHSPQPAETDRTAVYLRKLDASGKYVALSYEQMPRDHRPNDFSKQAIPYYQAEGPVWENDKVAFRLYFDQRNGKDIFGKTTSALVMDTVATYGDKYYHHFDPRWGMDILKVGKSLGAGALALQLQAGGRDTLVRVGPQIAASTEFIRVCDGPLRSILRLRYRNCQPLPGLKIDEITEEISIGAGRYYYESRVTVKGPATALVTGIVNLKSAGYKTLSVPGAEAVLSYDRQSENNDELGLAVLVPAVYRPQFGVTGTTGEIQNTYTATLRPDARGQAAFRFVAAWKASDPLFADQAAFERFILEELKKYASPVHVSWQKN